MNDDMEIFFDNSGSNYLESIIRSRILLNKLNDVAHLKLKLDELIRLEIDLAITGAEKATSEVRKAKVTPLKGI